jgi:hypothetical protein
VGHWGEPEDLAVLVVLASPLARYITGCGHPRFVDISSRVAREPATHTGIIYSSMIK